MILAPLTVHTAVWSTQSYWIFMHVSLTSEKVKWKSWHTLWSTPVLMWIPQIVGVGLHWTLLDSKFEYTLVSVFSEFSVPQVASLFWFQTVHRWRKQGGTKGTCPPPFQSHANAYDSRIWCIVMPSAPPPQLWVSSSTNAVNVSCLLHVSFYCQSLRGILANKTLLTITNNEHNIVVETRDN